MILRGIPLQNITKPPFGVTSAVWSLFPTTGPKGTKLSPRVIKDPSRDETTFSTSSVLTKMPTSLPCKGAKKSGMNSKQDMEIVTGWHVNSIHLTHWNSGSPICPICLQVHSLQSSSPKVTIRFNYFILPLDSLCFYLKESFHVSVKFFSIQKIQKAWNDSILVEVGWESLGSLDLPRKNSGKNSGYWRATKGINMKTAFAIPLKLPLLYHT